jgi:hypothetical protein
MSNKKEKIIKESNQEISSSTEEKNHELEILKLQIIILSERRDKLQAQMIIVEAERTKLIDLYNTKKDKVK